MIRAWKEGPLQAQFRGRFLNVDLEIAERCAALHVPDPQPEIDALIAATAIVRRLTLVTRNERDFARMPVAVMNPWSLPIGDPPAFEGAHVCVKGLRQQNLSESRKLWYVRLS